MKLDELIDKIVELREAKAILNNEVKEVNQKISELEKELVEACKEAGTDIARSGTHTATISTETSPTVTDWDSVYRWIKRNNAFYLLQRRINSAPWRDIVQARNGKGVPGIEDYVRTVVSVKKSRS